MKTLYLLRHGKSSWGDANLPDHERPLNERGHRAAVVMARHLGGLRHRPELILASTARRVGETLELLLPELGADIAVIRDQALYLAPPDILLSRLQSTSVNKNNVLIIGHNPGLQEFALQMAGEVASDAAQAARARMKTIYPTAALAVIAFPQARFWHEVDYGAGRFEAFTTPRDFAV